MRKIIVLNGLIAGSIVSAMLWITQLIFRSNNEALDNGMLIGFSTMIISLSLIFVAVKTVRDRHQTGAITFGRAFLVGIVITAIASLMYATTWEVYYNTSGADFVEWYSKNQLDKLISNNASEAEISKLKSDMQEFAVMYSNPLLRFCMTLLEIFPVGIIITLISAALLRRKDFLPSA
jgi:hypothetical protein